MNQKEIHQVTARDEKWVPTKERVKISTTNVRLETTVPQKEETFQVIINVIKNSTYYKAFTISSKVSELFMQQFWYTIKKVSGPMYKHPNMFMDHMHQPWRTLAAIINKCLSAKAASNDRLRKARIDILWGMFYRENVDYPELIWEDFAFQIDNMQLKKGRREITPYPRFTKIIINHFLSKHQSVAKLHYLHTHTFKDDDVVNRLKFVRIGKDFQEYKLPIPETMLTEGIKQSESYQMFIKYSTGLIPPKKIRGKGSQGKKTADAPQADVEVSDESNSKPARKQTSSRRVIKKKVSIYVDDNIIPDPDVALELGKSMSLTEAAEEEAARQVHATHERIVTESDPEPARRRPSGIAFRDTSSVSKKMSPDRSQKLKGVQTLNLEEKLDADTMQALKASRKSSRSQPHAGGSSEGTGTKPGVPNESTVILTTSSEGTGAKPGVPDKEKVTSEAKADVILDWGSEEESEYSEEENVDEEIDWVYSDEDEEKKDDDDKSFDDTGNGDEEITNTAKANAEKTKEVKDDNKKVKLPSSSSSLSIQSLSILTIPVLVISELVVLSTIPEIPTVTSTTTPLPPNYVSTISPVLLQQTTTLILTPPITTETPPITKIPDPLPAISQSVYVLEKDVQDLKTVDHTITLIASLRSRIPSAVNAYLGSSLGYALQKVLRKHTEELKQQYSQQVDYKEMIEGSVQANVINEVKNLLPKFLPKAVSDFATSVIQNTINKALEKTPTALA
ncbi:hypothetical protein Tco_1038860 [Tanacetum coccineum]